MTIQTQGSVQTQVLELVPREYEVFGGLEVDHHSISVTFADHGRLMKSLRLPYSAPQLLNYVRKHFPQRRVAFVYEAGPTGLEEMRLRRERAALRTYPKNTSAT